MDGQFKKLKRGLKNPQIFRKYLSIAAQLFAEKSFDVFMNFLEGALSALIYLDWRSAEQNNNVIFLCRDKGHSKDSTNDDGTEKFQIEDTLEEYGSKVLNFCWNHTGVFLGSRLKLWLLIAKHRPKVVIFSTYSARYLSTYSQPGVFFIERVVARIKSKIIFLWWDSVNSNFYNREIAPLTKLNGLHVLMDNPTASLKGVESPDAKILGLTSMFVNNSVLYPREKNIKISFFGQIDSYRSYRGEYIKFLMENNIPVYTSSNKRSEQIDYREYCEILGRSRIVINFSLSVDAHQMKGRCVEALHSGCLLLETENSQTSFLLRDGVDYVSFSSKDDMLKKVKYYLDNPEEADKIAKSGRSRLLSLYNSKFFWDKIFNDL